MNLDVNRWVITTARSEVESLLTARKVYKQ